MGRLAKPLAALSSGLLARKGQARPAMRPQTLAFPPGTADDLGWNDMGQPGEADLPPVLVERAALKDGVETIAPAPAGRKAAFTLRLASDRHLRLRLASAVQRRSAQLIVSEALDLYLDALPAVEELACQCPASEPKGD